MKVKTIKIAAGYLKNKNISFLENQDGLRPTSIRVRETLFNWLRLDITNKVCLDLFAGTGALGIESISQGAKEAYFIEVNKKSANQIKNNIKQLNIKEKAFIFNQSFDDFLKNNIKKIDIIFIDPPFNKGLVEKSFLLAAKLDPSYIYLEDNQPIDSTNIPTEQFEVYRHKKAGEVFYSLLKNKKLI